MAELHHGRAATPLVQGSPLDRIDRAIARIEAAAAARTASTLALDRRHDALRTRMAEAIAALDAVIAYPDSGPASGPDSSDAGNS